MMEKKTILIFCPWTPYGQSINVVNFFCSNLFIFCRKFAKTVKNARRHKMAEMRATSMATRTLLHKNAKGRKPFSNMNICLGGINKLFEAKNRIMNLTLISRRVFENRQYFIVYKSYFGAVFQERIFLCGITQNHLRLTS